MKFLFSFFASLRSLVSTDHQLEFARISEAATATRLVLNYAMMFSLIIGLISNYNPICFLFFQCYQRNYKLTIDHEESQLCITFIYKVTSGSINSNPASACVPHQFCCVVGQIINRFAYADI